MERQLGWFQMSHRNSICPPWFRPLRPTPSPPGKKGLTQVLAVVTACFVWPVAAARADTIQFSEEGATTVWVAESTGTLSIDLIRRGDGRELLTITYEVTALTATAGIDFVPAAGTLDWESGQPRKGISISIPNDNETEPTESFKVRVKGIGPNANLVPPAELTVLIEDDDPGVHFGQHFYRLPERAGDLTVTVFRGDDGGGIRRLRVRAEAVTARAGADFLEPSSELLIDLGQRTASLTVQLAADDDEVESIKTFQLHLYDANAPADLLATATVQIDDDDTAHISLGASMQHPARSGVLQVPVWREQQTEGAARVHFQTVEAPGYNPARPGIDFTPVSGQLEFKEGELFKIVEIPVLNPERDEWDDRRFSIRLSDPSDGVSLGRRETEVGIAFRPAATPPENRPPDRVFGHGERLAEAITPEGRFLLVGTREGTHLWHLPTGRKVREFDSGLSAQIAISIDGSQMAASDGNRITIWNIEGDAPRQTISVASRGLVFAPDGSQLVVNTPEGRLKIFALDHSAPWRSLPDRNVGEGARYFRLFSPAGRWLIADGGQAATIWDTTTRGIALALPAGENPEFAVSPDESRLLIASGGVAELWDLEHQVRMGEFSGVLKGALSHDAARVALAGLNQIEVRTAKGERLWHKSFSNPLREVAISRDGRKLAAVFTLANGPYYQSQLFVRDLETGDEITTLGEVANGIQFTPEGDALVYDVWNGSQSTIVAFDPISKRSIWRHTMQGFTGGPVVFSPDGTSFILPTFQGNEVRSTADGQLLSNLSFPETSAPPLIGWGPTGITEVTHETIRRRNPLPPHEVLSEHSFAPGVRGGSLSILSQLAGRKDYWLRQPTGHDAFLIDAGSLDVRHRFGAASLRPEAIGSHSFAALEAGTTRSLSLFDLTSRQRRRTFDLEGGLLRAALSPDDRWLFVHQQYQPNPESSQVVLRAFDIATGEVRWSRITSGLTGDVPLAATTHPGQFVFSPALSGVIHLQDVKRTDPAATVGGHGNIGWLAPAYDEDHMLALTMSLTGERSGGAGILRGETGQHLAMWNLRVGQIERIIEGAEPSLSNDGRHLLYRMGFNNFGWRLEDLVDGRTLQTWEATPGDSYRQLILSPDGDHVAALGQTDQQSAVWLWRASTGELVWKRSEPDTWVPSIQFSPDARFLLVHHISQTNAWLDLLRVSDGETGTINLPATSYFPLQFSPDGSRLLLLSSPAELWDIRSRQKVAAIGETWPWMISSASFAGDGGTLFLSVRRSPFAYDVLQVIDVTTWQLVHEAPLLTSYARLAALADEDALLISHPGGTDLRDGKGHLVARLGATTSTFRLSIKSSQVALVVGSGQFGLWDLRSLFNHRLHLWSSPSGLQLNWRAGTLQWAPDVNGPWTPLPGVQSPWSFPTTRNRGFYRVEGEPPGL